MDAQRPDFEKPLFPIEERIASLRATGEDGDAGVAQELERLSSEHSRLMGEIYAQLTPWQIVSKVSRHPKRPQSTDYIKMMCSDFCQLHGDRHFGDDPALLTGFARIGSQKVMMVAHRKGRDLDERMLCNFGCAHPEGYRKALKNMKLAEKYNLPIVTLVDTPGAYPGIGAEERGQAEAIAVNLREMSRLETPVLAVVIGEGGSGGALGIAVADRIAMLSFAWYSVISPEGCAAILWKKATPETNESAASALHLTAPDNLKLGVIDTIIDEPVGGAHRNPAMAAEALKRWILDNLRELKRFKPSNLVERRYERLRRLGEFETLPEPAVDD